MSIASSIKDTCANLSEKTGEFLAESIRTVDKYSAKDLLDYCATGKTPKKKEYDNQIELTKTKPHSVLIDDYNKLNGLVSDEFIEVAEKIRDQRVFKFKFKPKLKLLFNLQYYLKPSNFLSLPSPNLSNSSSSLPDSGHVSVTSTMKVSQSENRFKMINNETKVDVNLRFLYSLFLLF